MILPATKEEVIKAACNVLTKMGLIDLETFEKQAANWEFFPFISDQLGTIKVYWDLFNIGITDMFYYRDDPYPNIGIKDGDNNFRIYFYEDGDCMIATLGKTYTVSLYDVDDIRRKQLEMIIMFITSVFKILYGGAIHAKRPHR